MSTDIITDKKEPKSRLWHCQFTHPHMTHHYYIMIIDLQYFQVMRGFIHVRCHRIVVYK